MRGSDQYLFHPEGQARCKNVSTNQPHKYSGISG